VESCCEFGDEPSGPCAAELSLLIYCVALRNKMIYGMTQ
jgi:hypothetical protein